MKDIGLLYFEDGELVAEHKNARVYKMDNELFLEVGPGHTLWSLESELADHMVQLGDNPTGKCLEIGLGLGTTSRYLLTFPQVEHLTTIETNENIIKVHEQIKDSDRGVQMEYASDKHRILHTSYIEYLYQTNQRYDFIFIDCYICIDEDTLPMIADLYGACNRVLTPKGRIVAWVDQNTPEEHYFALEAIRQQYN